MHFFEREDWGSKAKSKLRPRIIVGHRRNLNPNPEWSMRGSAQSLNSNFWKEALHHLRVVDVEIADATGLDEFNLSLDDAWFLTVPGALVKLRSKLRFESGG